MFQYFAAHADIAVAGLMLCGAFVSKAEKRALLYLAHKYVSGYVYCASSFFTFSLWNDCFQTLVVTHEVEVFTVL